MNRVNVPQLRFKGFKGEWENKTLFDISKEVSYGMNAAAKAFNGTHKYIRITDIDSDSRKFIPNPLTSPEGHIDEKFKLKDNDLLFTRTGASVGKSYLYDSKDGALYYAGFLIKFNIAKANSYFVYSLTLKESYDKWVLVNSMRSGQPGLNAEEYKAFEICLPTIPEQQKIASFLSTVDEKIQQLSRRKELLAQYKKGVMQQLFSGKLRFKDENGEDYADWEEKRLDSMISKFVVPMRDKPKELKGEIPWCRIEDFDGKYLSKSKSGQGVSIKTVKEMNLKVYPIGTLLVSCSANLGFCAITETELITNQTFIGLVPNSKKVDVLYLLYVMRMLSHKLNTLSSGTTISYLSRQQFEQFKVPYPNLLEQQKIANFLSSIDDKIESVNQQITQTQSFKKGLLQQLFV
jgi:type I restriction enzyme S subunit